MTQSNTLKFLNATVLSFNMSLGYGSAAETTCTIDLIEDCDDGDDCDLNTDDTKVGQALTFPSGNTNYTFCGMLSSWTQDRTSTGKKYNVVLKDPRQLLENTSIIIDSILSGPIISSNYFNVYAYWEQVLMFNNNCVNFGLSGSSEKGMPYYNIITTLNAMDISIVPSTNASTYKVDFSTFPGFAAGSRTLPSWYKVPGPSITILQLLEDICNVLAYEFYVYLDIQGDINTLKVGLVDLNNPPAAFNNIINAFNGVSPKPISASYGQELRNEKNKAVIIGDSVHYFCPTNTFDFFFGEDVYGTAAIPVIPYGYDDCGFWINKKIETLNLSLANPFPSNGPYTISELDIRSALSSYELWAARAFDTNTPGTLNSTLRSMYPSGVTNINLVLDTFVQINNGLNATTAVSNNFPDGLNNPAASTIYKNQPNIVDELKKVHEFISNLGSTYYGKQFITRLDAQKICKKYDQDSETVVYSDTPTNNGAWLDYGITALGLDEPYLSHFRLQDNRLNGFASFELTFAPNVINNIVQNNTEIVRYTGFIIEGTRPTE